MAKTWMARALVARRHRAALRGKAARAVHKRSHRRTTSASSTKRASSKKHIALAAASGAPAYKNSSRRRIALRASIGMYHGAARVMQAATISGNVIRRRLMASKGSRMAA